MQVVIENRSGHDGVATGGHYGDWARIWVSREGIYTLKVVSEKHAKGPYHSDRVVVDVEPNEMFDHETDYIIVEHKRSHNPYLNGSSRHESYETIFGQEPDWASFHRKWREWVESNTESAADFLRRHPQKEVKKAAEHAARKKTKRKRFDAWEEVASLLGVTLQTNYSWTAVRAMPIRIAEKAGWSAETPRPRFQKREDSGALEITQKLR